MAFKYLNFWEATLQQAILAASTTAYIEAAMEALIPTLSGGDVFRVVLYDNDQDPEIVDVTAHSSGALTITRAKESTAAVAWSAGTRVTNDLTAAIVEQLATAGSITRFTGTGTGTNTILVTATAGTTIPVPSAGDEVFFQAANDITGAATLTYTNGTDTIGPTAIVHQDGVALETGDLQGGWFITLRYHSGFAKWVLTSQASYNEHAYQINDGALQPANRIPNGDFLRWNAATSFSSPASGTTVADNYYVEHDGSIGTYSVSQQAFTLGQTDVPGEPKYFLRWNHTVAGSGSSYRRLRVKLPGVERFAGRKVIRSVYLKADTARTVTGKLLQDFGTGGSPSTQVEAESVSFSVTTSWTRFEIPDTLPSISGKTLGSGADDALILSLDLPVNTTMTIDVAMDQFEAGHIATFPRASLPLSVQEGGSGGSYATVALLAAALATAAGALTSAANPDLVAIEALSSTGIAVRTGSGTWAQRSLADAAAGLTWTNPAGVAGNPTPVFSTAIVNYLADPLSAAELASITGSFGNAAFATIGSGVQAYDADLTTLGAGGSGARDFLGLGTSDSPQFTAINLGHASDTTLTRASAGVLAVEGVNVLTTATGAQLAASNAFTVANSLVINNSANAIRWGHGNTDYYIQGFAHAGAGTAILGFNGRQGTTGNTVRTDGSNKAVFLAGLNGYIGFQAANTLSTDNQTATEFFQIRGDVFDVRFTGAPTELTTGSVGLRGLGTPTSHGSGYTFVLADSGILHYMNDSASNAFTIPPNSSVAFPLGTVIPLQNWHATGTTTVVEGSGVTLRRGDGTAGTGTRTLGFNGAMAAITKTGTNEWYITGVFT